MSDDVHDIIKISDIVNILDSNLDKSVSIYIIRHGNQRIYKIGISDKPEKRVKQLQTGNPYPLKIIFHLTIAKKLNYRLFFSTKNIHYIEFMRISLLNVVFH